MDHVAQAWLVSSRFVRECFESVATQEIARNGLSLDEQQALATPRYLGIDEFARRKGHVYETILCDLEARRVLEVSAGRKLEEVRALLDRLSDPDAVKAVSMDMSASSCRRACPMALSKARTTAPKPSCAKPMAIAIAPIFVCGFYWGRSPELFTSFPRKDGDPGQLYS